MVEPYTHRHAGHEDQVERRNGRVYCPVCKRRYSREQRQRLATPQYTPQDLPSLVLELVRNIAADR